ncbi:hypothetical protein ScPMuIL_016341 [Solemya velum]
MASPVELQLDLDNFETSQFENCKYVLTSPRSLEACSRIGVKPVDLLYKPLAELQEELLPEDIPLRTIYNIYDDHEQDRQRKLALCKLERRKMMLQPNSGRKQYATVVTSRFLFTLPDHLKRIDIDRYHNYVHYTYDDLNKASLQRRRTAWAASVGHQRVSQYEVNQRASEMNDESTKLREELLSRKDRKQTNAKKTRKSSKGITISQSKRSSSANSTLNRSLLSDAKPIISTKVKRALGGTPKAKRCPLTPKDQKILELIVSKGEEEKIHQKERHMAEVEWIQQRKQEDVAKKELENHRRRMLAEEARIRNMKKNKREDQRRKAEISLLEEKAKLLNLSKKEWELRSQQQQIRQEMKMIEKRDDKFMKKQSQEQNLNFKNEDEANMQVAMRKKFMSDMKLAEQRRDVKMLRDSMKFIEANRNERNAFEQRWEAIQKDSKDMVSSMENFLESKHRKSKSKHERILHMKQKQLEINKLEREKKQLEAQLRQKQLDSEMDRWRDTLNESHRFVEDKAFITSLRTTAEKARKAHDARVEKERGQKNNIKKIHKEVEAWRRETLQEVERKDKKSDLIKHEKDQVLEQSRFLAHTSQQFREQLKQRYGSDTFDKKVHAAEMFNRMGSGPVSALRNSSSIDFS